MSAVSLDLLDRRAVRTRARSIAIAAVFLGLAVGGLVGLVSGATGLIATTCIVALPLLLLAHGESRKAYSLEGAELSVRMYGTRRVDLARAESLDILVTDVRGMRTIGLLAKGPPKGKAINVALAMYQAIGSGKVGGGQAGGQAGDQAGGGPVGSGQVGGRELDIYALRRLADALASTGDTRALVLSELFVAQLKAEARGEPGANRPLYRIGELARGGRMARRLPSDAVAQFVAALD